MDPYLITVNCIEKTKIKKKRPEMAFLRINPSEVPAKRAITWNSGCVGVLVHVLHVLHQILAADADLLAERAAARVGATQQGGVVLFCHYQQKKENERSF